MCIRDSASTPGQDPASLPLSGNGTTTTGYGTSSAATNPNGGNTDLNSLVGLHSSERVQVDLMWKF